MGVQRFVGSNNREAMGRVRAALGDDALIPANRATDQGVEILALAEDDSSGYAPSEQAAPDRAGQAAVAPAQQRVPHHAPAGPDHDVAVAVAVEAAHVMRFGGAVRVAVEPHELEL